MLCVGWQMHEKKHLPSLGPAVPRWGNKLTRAFGRLLLNSYRWHVEGQLPNAARFVIIVAPHTSSWDFLPTMGTMLAVGFQSYWLIADTYNWWPLGNFLGWLGGIPVDRSMRRDLVSQIVKRFKENDKFILAMSPEGTRKSARTWKTGFWHIAAGAGVPIQIVAVDYEKRATIFGPVIEPSDNIEADMEKIQMCYQGVRAKHPDQFDAEYL